MPVVADQSNVQVKELTARPYTGAKFLTLGQAGDVCFFIRVSEAIMTSMATEAVVVVMVGWGGGGKMT